MHAPLSCESMVCLPSMRLPLPVSLSGIVAHICCSFLTFCSVGEFGSLFFAFRFLHRFGLTWVRAISFSIRPLFLFIAGLWADQCSCHATPLLLPCYHLTYTCQASFGPAMYFSFIQYIFPSIFAGLILMLLWFPFWASLAHIILLGIFGPFYSYIPMDFCDIFLASLA